MEPSEKKEDILIYRFEEYANVINNIKKKIDKNTNKLYQEEKKLRELQKGVETQEKECEELGTKIQTLDRNYADLVLKFAKSLYGEKIAEVLYHPEETLKIIQQRPNLPEPDLSDKEYMNGSRAPKNQPNFSNQNIRGGDPEATKKANDYLQQRREESKQLESIQEDIRNDPKILKTRGDVKDSYEKKYILNRLREESNIYDHKQKIQDKKNEFDEKQQIQYYPGPIGENEGFVDQKSYQLILSDSIIQGGGERRQNSYETEHKRFQKKIHDQLQSMSGFSDF